MNLFGNLSINAILSNHFVLQIGTFFTNQYVSSKKYLLPSSLKSAKQMILLYESFIKIQSFSRRY
jgi:hypothetical protein